MNRRTPSRRLAADVITFIALAAQPPRPALGVYQTSEQAMRERAGNVLFMRPAGWHRNDQPERAVSLVPPDVPPGGVVLVIQSLEFEGRMARQWFDGYLQSLVQANGGRVLEGGEVRSSRLDGFEVLSTETVIQPRAGAGMWVKFVMAPRGLRAETFFFLAREERLYHSHVAALDKLLETVRFAEPPPASTRGDDGRRPPPAGVAPQLYVGAVNRGHPIGQWGTDHLALFSDGWFFQDLPEEGFDAFDVERSRREKPLFWGRYTRTGSALNLEFLDGRRQVLQFDHQGRLTRNGIPYFTVASCDGMRLDGIYGPPGSDPRTITFRPDGTFRDAGILAALPNLDYTTGELKHPPSPGMGTYRCSRNTLALVYHDGRIVRFPFYVLEDREPTSTLFLNQTQIVRR